MARSIPDITAEILQNIADNPELSVISSNTSDVALYKVIANVVATSLNFSEQIQDQLKLDLEAIIKEGGTPLYYKQKFLEFSYGDILTVDPVSVPTYINPTGEKIITRVAVVTTPNIVTIKLAKGDNNNLEALTEDELTAATAYGKAVQFAGVYLDVKSTEADQIEIVGEIYYDGQIILTEIKENIFNVIKEYFANLEFNGTLKISDLENAIHDLEGVKDLDLTSVKWRRAADTVSEQIEIVRIQQLESGYCIPEETTGHTLEDTLTFIAV